MAAFLRFHDATVFERDNAVGLMTERRIVRGEDDGEPLVFDEIAQQGKMAVPVGAYLMLNGRCEILSHVPLPSR